MTYIHSDPYNKSFALENLAEYWSQIMAFALWRDFCANTRNARYVRKCLLKNLLRLLLCCFFLVFSFLSSVSAFSSVSFVSSPSSNSRTTCYKPVPMFDVHYTRKIKIMVDFGIISLILLGFRTLSIVRYSKGYNVLEPGSVSALIWGGGRHLLCWFPWKCYPIERLVLAIRIETNKVVFQPLIWGRKQIQSPKRDEL
jgi:hypothetical protein